MAKIFPLSALPNADLVIDAVYEAAGNSAYDVVGKLIPGACNKAELRRRTTTAVYRYLQAWPFWARPQAIAFP